MQSIAGAEAQHTSTIATAGVFVIAKSAGSILIHKESTGRLKQTNFYKPTELQN